MVHEQWNTCPRKEAIKSKWVYKTKYDIDESIKRCKVSLVILGKYQVKVIDYHETVSPKAKMTIVRTFLRLQLKQDRVFITWIYKMHSCMVTWMKRYT